MKTALRCFGRRRPRSGGSRAYRLAACLGDGCILFAIREESATVAQLTEELLPLARENGFNLWANMAQIFRGWTMADIEGSRAGTALMQKTIQALEDQEVDKSCYLGLLGKAYLRTGQFERAGEAVRQGLNHANKFGEHYYTAELLRLRGEVELCCGVEPRHSGGFIPRSDSICTATSRKNLGTQSDREPHPIAFVPRKTWRSSRPALSSYYIGLSLAGCGKRWWDGVDLVGSAPGATRCGM